ncbi:ATP-binding cassette domain-containing protein [Alkalibacter rhizosphaerae]|uniref:ATP-binding cassette domain-containing protein n=1 Tax=Alkalibacter rhizosphaerae TaxID=2815577 RepID=A0A975AHD9_9FIRM|nr:ATP-binding cassette domain-containing protein [Alkalibacter rhizosphaerae]
MIKIENITKIYSNQAGDFLALENVSLNVDKGDIYGVIGLSGAGKSTLVRCINLLERPTEGKVYIDGEEITAMGEDQLRKTRQSLGMIFQDFNLLMQRSVTDNIRFPLEIAKVNKKDAENRVAELLELVGLQDKANSYPAQLSGGQKQRVAIARALANHPKVLLCDEATSALDPVTTLSILKLLKDINEKLGVTIIIITHEMKVVETICNKVAVIESAKIVKDGWTKDIIHHFGEV